MTTIKNFKHFEPLKGNKDLIPDSSGVYIIVLKAKSKLPKVNCDCICTKLFDREVIYVGISSKILRKRDYGQHFNGNAGSSTLRKSLGSLFGFKKIPRSANQDDGKTKFNETDESFITNWMKNNLEFYYLTHPNYVAIENLLIEKLNPPLNLSKNYNIGNSEFRRLLVQLRSIK